MYGGSARELPYMALPAAFLIFLAPYKHDFSPIMREISVTVAESRAKIMFLAEN